MILHNHISGVLEPSGDDMTVTKRMIEAGRIMNIPVLDHIIVAGGSGAFYSFRENFPEMFNITVTEAVREAQIRNGVPNVAEGGSAYGNGVNKASGKRMQESDISSQGMSKQETSIREKLREDKPLAKVEELVEENYNQIDNQLSNTYPGDDTAEKRRKEAGKRAAEHKASEKRSSMRKRLLERQKQVSRQAPPSKDQKTKHKVRER